MKKMNLKKMLTMALVAMMAISTMSISVSAEQNTKISTESGMIDYSIYDSDMVYIQEHADMVEQYNEQIKKTRAMTYTEWSWSNGIYSRTSGVSSGILIPFYFIPTTNSLYFNVEVNGCSKVPYMTVNKYNSDGTLTYVGTYYITANGTNSYAWSNYRRSLTAGTKYVFGVLGDTNWSSALIDIYNQPLI